MGRTGGAGGGRVMILGVGVDPVNTRSAVPRLERMISGEGRHQVVVLPVNSIMAARSDGALRRALQCASLVVPDGVPILWAARILGRPLPGRTAGTDLLWELCRSGARKGYSFYFLGSRPRVLDRLVRTLSLGCPGLRVAGSYAPPAYSEFPREENERMIRLINAAAPDVLWVGLGAPKQERWIHEHLGRLEVRVAIGVGAAFDLASGTVRRAPPWMQRSGLEWFHRFLMEPRRMFRRYFIDAMPFLPLVAAQRLTGAFARKPRA